MDASGWVCDWKRQWVGLYTAHRVEGLLQLTMGAPLFLYNGGLLLLFGFTTGQSDLDPSGSSTTPSKRNIRDLTRLVAICVTLSATASWSEEQGVQRLISTTTDDYGPAWSPDGSQIIYYSESSRSDKGGLYIVDLETRRTARVLGTVSRLSITEWTGVPVGLLTEGR